MEEILKVGIVGCGNIYKLAHESAWKSIPKARVVSTCDIVEERAREAAQEMGADTYFMSIDDLLKHPDINVVDICTPSHTHAELSIKALNSGRHVICEKPIDIDIQVAERMIEASRTNGKHLFIGHTRRFDPRWVQIKEQIVSDRIGKVIFLHRTECSWGGFPAEAWQWRQELSGGALLDLGIHIADLFCWLLDDEPVEVFAKGRRLREESKTGGAYDFGIIHISFQRGAQGTVEVSWAYPREWSPFYCTMEIIGTKGKIQYSDKASVPMMVVGDGYDFPRYSPLLSTIPEAFREEIEHFLMCIEQGKKPRVTVENALRALRVIRAAERSIQEERHINLMEGGIQ